MYERKQMYSNDESVLQNMYKYENNGQIVI